MNKLYSSDNEAFNADTPVGPVESLVRHVLPVQMREGELMLNVKINVCGRERFRWLRTCLPSY